MKLKHLLPVATIASVATTLGAAASCSCSNGMKNGDFKANGEFESEFDQVTYSEPVNENKALEIYLDEVQRNSKILSDDLLYNQNGSYSMYSEQQENLKEMTASVKFKKVDLTNQTLSFHIKTSLKTKVDGMNEEDYVESNIDCNVENMKYAAKYIGQENEGLNLNGQLIPKYTELDSKEAQINYLKNDKSWKLSGSFMFYIESIDERVSGSKSYDYSNFENDFDADDDTVFDHISQLLGFESYHLDLIEYKE